MYALASNLGSRRFHNHGEDHKGRFTKVLSTRKRPFSVFANLRLKLYYVPILTISDLYINTSSWHESRVNVSSRSSSLKISTTISVDGVIKTAIQFFCNIHVVSFQYVITFPYQIYFILYLHTIFCRSFFPTTKIAYVYMKMMYDVHESMEYADMGWGKDSRMANWETGPHCLLSQKKSLTNTIISFVSYLHGVLLVVVKQPPDV